MENKVIKVAASCFITASTIAAFALSGEGPVIEKMVAYAAEDNANAGSAASSSSSIGDTASTGVSNNSETGNSSSSGSTSNASASISVEKPDDANVEKSANGSNSASSEVLPDNSNNANTSTEGSTSNNTQNDNAANAATSAPAQKPPVVDERSVIINVKWNDNNNYEGQRKDGLQVACKMYANGDGVHNQKVGEERVFTLTKDTNQIEFKVPKTANVTDDAFQTVNCVVSEQITINGGNSAVDGKYTYTLKKEADGNYTLTADYNTQKKNNSVTINWNDENNNDGKRPSNVKVTVKDENGVSKTYDINSGSNTSTSIKFTDFNAYTKNGKDNNLTVEAPSINGYEVKVSGTTITATHASEKVSYDIETVWNDKEYNKKRPKSYGVTLKSTGGNSRAFTINDGNKVRISDLNKYTAGKQNEYSLVIGSTTNYTSSVKLEGSTFIVTLTYNGKATGSNKSSGTKNDTMATTTLHSDSKKKSAAGNASTSDSSTPVDSNLDDDDYINVPIKLIWNDNGDETCRRDVKIKLVDNDGNSYTGTLSHENGYATAFAYVPLITEDNKDLEYNVIPDTVPGYVTHVYKNPGENLGFTIENYKAKGNGEAKKKIKLNDANKLKKLDTSSATDKTPSNDLTDTVVTKTNRTIPRVIGGLVGLLAAFIGSVVFFKFKKKF